MIRGDKHSQFDLVFTPRVSAVLGLDKDRKHNLRASFQTGFRNPSPQEGYINLDVGSAIIIGGFEDNFQNYTVNGINGADIHAGLVTLGSFLQFLGTGGTDQQFRGGGGSPKKLFIKNKASQEFSAMSSIFED